MLDKIIDGNIKSSIISFIGRLFQELVSLRSKFFHGNPITIASYIFKISRVTGNSEYDVFCKSAENWPIGHERIEQDFRVFLLHQRVPHYVTAFVRKNKKHIDELNIPLF